MSHDTGELLAHARRLGLEVRAEGDKLKVRCPRQYEALGRALLERKAEVLAILAAEGQGVEPSPPALVCPHCGAELSAEDVEKCGDCPKCRRTLPGWEDAPHPAGVMAVPEEPDPTVESPLAIALAKLRAELGPLEGYDADLAQAVLEAAARDPKPWPFDGLGPPEWEALLAWAAGLVPGPQPKTGPSPPPSAAGFREKPDRCPACGGTRFYQPWSGPGAGLWFCVNCNPGLRPEGEPAAFGGGPEALRDLANGVYVLARRHGFPELEVFPGRKIGPGPEAWKEALRRPLEAGYEPELWTVMFALEELVSSETERAYADRVLALAQELGYPEIDGLLGPIRRIPAGPTAWAAAVGTLTPAERRFLLKKLRSGGGPRRDHRGPGPACRPGVRGLSGGLG